MIDIRKISQHTVYENPEANLVSRHGYFPGLVRLSSGTLVCLFVIGEAFESVDQTTWISISEDQGHTWRLHGCVYDKSIVGIPVSDCLKPTLLQDGRLIAVGYRFDRSNPDRKLVNFQTGGLRPADNIISFSQDGGFTWTTPRPLSRSRPEALELSGPCIQLGNGDLLAGGGPLPLWDGTIPSGKKGILLRSCDQGLTWNEDGCYFQSGCENVLPLETRFCQIPDGRIFALVWAHDAASGKNLPNQITVSEDFGKTWSSPIDTGFHGQASNLIPLEEELLMTIHAQREDCVGLYVRVIKFTDNQFRIMAEVNLWDKAASAKITSYSDMSDCLKFGQPSLTQLNRQEYLATHWAIIEGQGKILMHRLHITGLTE